MTKAELDKELIEKKYAKLSKADCAVLLDGFALNYVIPGNLSEDSIKRLVELNLIRKTKSNVLPGGIMLESKTGYFFELTNFGKMMRQKLSLQKAGVG